jgi:membrane-associated protein
VIDSILDVVLHLDRHLDGLTQSYGSWVYGILFLVIFAETGLVATPFLPGDSLLFAVGTLASRGMMDVEFILLLLIVAAILGDSVNYWIGHKLGRRAFSGKYRFFKQEYLLRTERFYERYGPATIVLARFIPIIRTFAPFVAGIGRMRYHTFLTYNVAGAIAWVTLFVVGGYFFGSLPFVQRNFSLVIVLIIVMSILPAVIEYVRRRRASRTPS